MINPRLLLSLVVIALLTFLVACSSGDDDDNAPSGAVNPPAATGSDGSGGGTGDGSGGGDGSGSEQDTGDDVLGGDASDAEILSNCPELTDMYNAFASGGLAAPGSTADLGDVTNVLQTAAANAPEEIRADMQILADALGEFQTMLADLGVDLSNPATFASLSEADIQQLTEAFDEPALEQASNNIDAWITANCQ